MEVLRRKSTAGRSTQSLWRSVVKWGLIATGAALVGLITSAAAMAFAVALDATSEDDQVRAELEAHEVSYGDANKDPIDRCLGRES